jgi:hypothetical protein
MGYGGVTEVALNDCSCLKNKTNYKFICIKITYIPPYVHGYLIHKCDNGCGRKRPVVVGDGGMSEGECLGTPSAKRFKHAINDNHVST